MVDLLGIVQVFEHIQQFLHALGIVVRQFDGVFRTHRHAGFVSDQTCRFQRLFDRFKISIRRQHLNGTVFIRNDVICARIQRHFHHLVLAGAGGKDELTAVLELEYHRPFRAHIAAMFTEGVADLGNRANLVIRHGIDNDGGSANTVPLVADLFIHNTLQISGRLGDAVLHVLRRHIGCLALFYGQTQARIDTDITAAHAGSDHDLAHHPGPNALALLVLAPLAVLNIGPFAVSCHGKSFKNRYAIGLIVLFGDFMAPTNEAGIQIGQRQQGASAVQCFLRPDKANRHGLITGATGTGKTITLQTLAEGFSRIGVPVFMADIKGDLTGIALAGQSTEKLVKILAERALLAPDFVAFPTTLWDVFGEQGHPVRATVSDLGPLLLSRMLNLNETQAGVLQLVFKIADDDGLLLLDLKDLRAMCQHVGDNASSYTTEYGNVSAASIGAIQRGLMQIEGQGGEKFFGEPMLNIADFMQTDTQGWGVVNILAADKLMNAPRLYSTFLLWMLSELFETLPEVGDLDKPKMVFFFDEAHLLFNDAPKVLIERIELVVRLVRSKGVGVYFVTQNPLDIPDSVLAQLGNRVQHALRAFTPRDQKAVKSAAETMRANPGLDIGTAITELAVGEALVSLLDEKGRPSVTERVYVLPPSSQIGPITAEQRKALLESSIVAGVYEKAVDRDSAFEAIKGRTQQKLAPSPGTTSPPVPSQGPVRHSGTPAAEAPTAPERGILDGIGDLLGGGTRRTRASAGEQMIKSAASSIGREVGRQIIRGVLGSIFGGSRR